MVVGLDLFRDFFAEDTDKYDMKIGEYEKALIKVMTCGWLCFRKE